MKLFGDPELERKVKRWRDKLAAAIVLAATGAVTFCGVIWILGAMKYFAFKIMGVA